MTLYICVQASYFLILLPSIKRGIENVVIYPTTWKSPKGKQFFLIEANDVQQQQGHRLYSFSEKVSSWISSARGDIESEPLRLNSQRLTGVQERFHYAGLFG